MPRRPTPRPVGEHLATIARVLRQIETVPVVAAADAGNTKGPTIGPTRARKIKKALGLVLTELQAEMSK